MTESHDPGTVALFGSGETSRTGGRLFERLAGEMAGADPLRVAVLETPAGFEPNSDRVAGRIADFLRMRLAGRHPVVEVVPARRRGTPFSPDDPALLGGLSQADLVFLGPGSPTYAVRQLRDSRAWHTVVARHRLGATVVFASAAMVAIGAFALPVYEIYKVGEPLHWQPGLDLFGAYGLSLAFVPHWNNRDGGRELDTSRCYMGRSRFAGLHALLPAGTAVVGVDEDTALVIDLSAGRCEVHGQGAVAILREGRESRHDAGGCFDLSALGPFERRTGRGDVPADVWASALPARGAGGGTCPAAAPAEVRALAAARHAARVRCDWAEADALRERIGALGWRVSDGPDGERLEPASGGG
jgi:cyanophycinase-like exopeptidase